ncbi:MAG: hypothetical protein MZV49_13295 [Rhodopseudomonas palustris]|nr:hypothetical protein [Rhodopseudomonas palustris]
MVSGGSNDQENTLLFLLSAILSMGVASYKYPLIRDGSRLYVMEKDPGTFDRIFVDVSGWDARDFARHPVIGAHVMKKRWKSARQAEKGLRQGLRN